MPDPLTYRKVIGLLRELGYSQSSVQWNGTRQWVFEHKDFERATIYMAEQPLDHPVHPFHINSIRATLKAHGIIEDDLALLSEKVN